MLTSDSDVLEFTVNLFPLSLLTVTEVDVVIGVYSPHELALLACDCNLL